MHIYIYICMYIGIYTRIHPKIGFVKLHREYDETYTRMCTPQSRVRGIIFGSWHFTLHSPVSRGKRRIRWQLPWMPLKMAGSCTTINKKRLSGLIVFLDLTPMLGELQWVAVSCSGCSGLQCVFGPDANSWCGALCCSVLQCVAVCCGVSQCVTVCCSVFLDPTLTLGVLQCVAVCRRVL